MFPQPVIQQPVHQPSNPPQDNPLDVFSSDDKVCMGPGGKCSFGSSPNIKLGALVAILSLVVGAVPLDGMIGKYVPFNKLPMGSSLMKAMLVGGMSTVLVGFLCSK